MEQANIPLEHDSDPYIYRKGSFKTVKYQDEILKPIARLYTAAFGPTFVLMDDVCPHTADLVNKYLEN
ncbi:hypothetical protein TNCV_852811 [Trichonephila clavipes]|nr:hypothetical protein TNCV_852811 [Trichonephila clavipes]